GNGRVVRDPLLEHLGVHGCCLNLGDTHCRGGTCAWVEDGHLTEHIGWAHDGQQVLTAIGSVASQLNLAGGDDVQAVAWLTFFEDGGAAWETHGFHLLNQVIDSYRVRSEEHTSELQSRFDIVCRLLLEKKNERNR